MSGGVNPLALLPPGATLDDEPSGPATQLPSGATLDPVAPPSAATPSGGASPPIATVGPSGSSLTDAGRMLATAGLDAAAGAAATPVTIAGGIDYLARKAGYPTHLAQTLNDIPNPIHPQHSFLPTFDQAQQGLQQITGAPIYQPASEAGKLALGALTAAPQAIFNPASLPAALAGGAGSILGAQLLPDHPILGALLGGGAAGAGAQSLGRALSGAVTGGEASISPQTAQMVQNLQSLTGKTIPAPYLSSNKMVKHLFDMSNNLPLSGGAAADADIRASLPGIMAQQMGSSAGELNAGVMAANRQRLGNGYDTLLGQVDVPVTNGMLTNLQGVIDRAALRNDATVPTVQRQVDNIIDTAANNNGTLPGPVYKGLMKRDGPIMGLSDPQARQDLVQTMKGEFSANATPGQVQQLGDLDRQYRAMKSLEPVVEAASTNGDATPGKLAQAARNNANLAYQDGGPMATVAQGARAMASIPDSGTAWKELAGKAITGGIPALLAGGAGEVAGGHLAGTAGLLGAMLLNRAVINPAMRSPMLTNRLVSTALKGGGYQLPAPDAAMLGRLLLQQQLASPSATATTAN